MRSFLFMSLLVACGSNNATVDAPRAIDAPKAVDAPSTVIDAPAIDAAPSIDAPPADITMNLTGGANALLWDAATSTLYLTDGNADTLVKFTDANGLQVASTLPPETAGISLGGMVKRADGSILTANFGFGTQGTLFSTTGTISTALTGMDATRRRIGIAQDSTGVLYTSYFTSAAGAQTGGVATVTIANGVATETEIVGAGAALKKVVGLAATTTALYVSDQTNKKIVKVTLPGNTVSDLATVTTADLLFMMPNGDLLTGGGPTIQRITQAGVVTALPNTGFEQVRGLAYDPAGHRLFIVDHSATVGTPDKLHIQPLAN